LPVTKRHDLVTFDLLVAAEADIVASYLGIAWLIELGWLTEPGR
jgi:hypothetical protein